MKLLLFVTLMLGLTGCADNLRTLQSSRSAAQIIKNNKSENEFAYFLSLEYLQLAKKEEARRDWSDSEYFARKGLDALSGKIVPPEVVIQRKIQKEAIGELEWARKRMLTIFNNGATKFYPKDSAHTQALFDCWIESQEEYWIGEFEICKSAFNTEISQLEQKIYDMLTENQTYVVYFALGKSSLDHDGKTIIRDVASLAKTLKSYTFNVSGHADKSGSKEKNVALSRKRAEHVIDILVSENINKDLINETYYGANKPVKNTEYLKTSQENRRVEIQLKGVRK